MFKSLLVVKHNKILEKATIAIFKEKTKKDLKIEVKEK